MMVLIHDVCVATFYTIEIISNTFWHVYVVKGVVVKDKSIYINLILNVDRRR